MRLISAEYMAQHWTLKNCMTCYRESELPLSQLWLGGGAFSCYWISVSMLLSVMYLTSNSPHLSASSFVYTDVR